MSKKNELKERRPSRIAGFFLAAFAVNFSALYWHNDLLPFIYLALLFFYLLLLADISEAGRINFQATLVKVFLKNSGTVSFYLRWLMFVFFPAFFALYYFDFVLLLMTLLVNSSLSYLILKEKR